MKRTLISGFLLLAVFHCPAFDFKLATSEPLHSTQQELKVKGRQGLLINQKLSFGDYYTTKVKRSSIRKWSATTGMRHFIWGEHVEGRQSVHFGLTDGLRTSEVHCLSNIAGDDLLIGRRPDACPGDVAAILRIGTTDNENNFSAAIYIGDEVQPWEIFLSNNEAQYRRENYIGYADRGSEYYTIVPLWKIAGKNGKVSTLLFGSAGYEIRNSEGVAKAAVSLINKGVVYMGQLDNEEKFLMANICAALLLQGDISQ